MIIPVQSDSLSKSRLYVFVYGALGIFLMGLCLTAFVFSETYLKKEQARASDSSEVIGRFFDAHYQYILQEMWGNTYNSIDDRVKEIAKQLGSKSYELTLVDKSNRCVFNRSGEGKVHRGCELSDELTAQVSKLKSGQRETAMHFDYASNRYVYVVALYAGRVFTGYLYATLSDPYDFNRENTVTLVMKNFSVPILGILLVWLICLYIADKFILKPYLQERVELEKKRAVADLAGKVAHNIRSPLVVLDSVVKAARSTAYLDESQRKLLLSVSTRIETIANDLMIHFTPDSADSNSRKFCFLWPVVDSIVAEKLVLLGQHSRTEIQSQIAPELFDVSLPLSSADFSSILSNLINNSLQAIEGMQNRSGLVTIEGYLSKSHDGRCILAIKDNGKGISAEVLEKLRVNGGTYGKVGGAGIGLKDSRAIVSKIGGVFSIESKVGQGTTVQLELPLAIAPKWLAKQIELREATQVVVLEDDPGMILLWKDRLKKAALEASFLTKPEDFSIEKYPPEKTRYIFDYELAGSSITGLDLIARHSLKDRATLVTSYYFDPRIQAEIEVMGARMLPKFMAPKVEVFYTQQCEENLELLYDMILIDDELMVHDLWSYGAKSAGKVIKTISKQSEIDWNKLRRDIPIFIDLNLGDGPSGIDVAQNLFKQGFFNLSLTTGEGLNLTEVPKFIRDVRSKEFPI